MLFDKIINTAFSFGAAIVIFGAWGKIEHKEFGSTALTAGLLTETAIFCIYGALEWRKKGEPAATPPTPSAPDGTQLESGAAPVKQEQVEALTDSIRQASQVLTKIFRV